MPVGQQDPRCISLAVPSSLTGSFDQSINFLLSQIFSHSVSRVGQSPRYCSVYDCWGCVGHRSDCLLLSEFALGSVRNCGGKRTLPSCGLVDVGQNCLVVLG